MRIKQLTPTGLRSRVTHSVRREAVAHVLTLRRPELHLKDVLHREGVAIQAAVCESFVTLYFKQEINAKAGCFFCFSCPSRRIRCGVSPGESLGAKSALVADSTIAHLSGWQWQALRAGRATSRERKMWQACGGLWTFLWGCTGSWRDPTLPGRMHIVEYRIPLPMSVEEYRIAQLYMIQVRWTWAHVKPLSLLPSALWATVLSHEHNKTWMSLVNYFFFFFFVYVIQKKSRQESSSSSSRVEILENTPYENGPGGSGQYTRKIYHIGSHLPSWIRSILPKTALMVEEEAWNAYPYCRTKFTCPFMERFMLDIETVYRSDRGKEVCGGGCMCWTWQVCICVCT